MSHAQFRPMYLLTGGSPHFFVSQAIPAISRVNDDNMIQSQYPILPATLPQQPPLYYHSLPPTPLYSPYQPDHPPADDSNDVQLPHDSTIPDNPMFPHMSSAPFSPPLTPQLPEQLEPQPPYLKCCTRRHNALAIINPDTLEEINVNHGANEKRRRAPALTIVDPSTLQEIDVDHGAVPHRSSTVPLVDASTLEEINEDHDADLNDVRTNAVAIIDPKTLQEVNVDDDTDPNDEHSVKSKETLDNTWMFVEDITVALNNLKEGFENFRNQATKDIEELRNQNYQFQNQVTKDIEELRDQVTKNQEELSDLRALISVSTASKLMLSKLNEIDSFEEFCVMAREAGMPCEPEDYEEFKFNKERMLEMNTRLLRKLLSW